MRSGSSPGMYDDQEHATPPYSDGALILRNKYRIYLPIRPTNTVLGALEGMHETNACACIAHAHISRLRKSYKCFFSRKCCFDNTHVLYMIMRIGNSVDNHHFGGVGGGGYVVGWKHSI